MPSPRSLVCCLVLLSPWPAMVAAQELVLLPAGPGVSLRGLCPVSDRVIWASGSGGSVGRSVDSGKSWYWQKVTGFEATDFRDIEAFSDQDCTLLGITRPAGFVVTGDGGSHWTATPGMEKKGDTSSLFLDAMDFRGKRGIAIGDPLNARAPVAYTTETTDGSSAVGWKTGSRPAEPALDSGEAFFASSGSNIRWTGNGGDNAAYVYVSGGKRARLFYRGEAHPLDLLQGKESTGANSLALDPTETNRGYIVGGDFKQDTVTQGNAVAVTLHPFSQRRPAVPPHGYRSCVEYIDGKRMICCGTSGVDVSEDGGDTWRQISSKAFHVCRKSKSGRSVFLAGPKGALAILRWP